VHIPRETADKDLTGPKRSSGSTSEEEMAITRADRARQAGITLGVLIAVGFAIWQFPAPSSTGAPANAAGSATAGATAALSAPAQSALDQILGPGHSVITASASYATASTRQSTTYDPKHVAVLNQSSTTQPGYQASVTDNGVSRTVTDTTTAAGAIQRLTVAVVVDATLRPAPKLATIRQAVTAAMGLQRSRGDKITVALLPMPAAAAKAGSVASAVPATGAAWFIPYLPSGFGAVVAVALLMTLAMDALRRRPAQLS
jgi:flagellar M-ring protein FliF